MLYNIIKQKDNTTKILELGKKLYSKFLIGVWAVENLKFPRNGNLNDTYCPF